jgi:hypothetical protein
MKLVCLRCGFKPNTINDLKEHYSERYVCEPKYSDVSIGRLLYNLFEYEKAIEKNKQLERDLKKIKRYNCLFCRESFINLKSSREHMVDCSEKTVFEPNYLSDDDFKRDDNERMEYFNGLTKEELHAELYSEEAEQEYEEYLLVRDELDTKRYENAKNKLNNKDLIHSELINKYKTIIKRYETENNTTET